MLGATSDFLVCPTDKILASPHPGPSSINPFFGASLSLLPGLPATCVNTTPYHAIILPLCMDLETVLTSYARSAMPKADSLA
jgi:hypothetical protein